jgi:hypothetical protein
LTEPDRAASEVSEAANDASRGSFRRVGGFSARLRASGPFGWVLLALAVLAAFLLVVAEFSEISSRTIGIGACGSRVGSAVCSTSGHESHAFALLILAPVALVMAWGAVVGGSRAASFAVMAVGAAVLVIALLIDLPKLDDRRNLELLYNDVVAHTGPAFRLELVGGVLLLLVGGLALLRERAGERLAARAARRAEATASAEPAAAVSAGPGRGGPAARARRRLRRGGDDGPPGETAAERFERRRRAREAAAAERAGTAAPPATEAPPPPPAAPPPAAEAEAPREPPPPSPAESASEPPPASTPEAAAEPPPPSPAEPASAPPPAPEPDAPA